MRDYAFKMPVHSLKYIENLSLSLEMFILYRDYTDCTVFEKEWLMKNKRGHSKVVKRVAFIAQEAFDSGKSSK